MDFPEAAGVSSLPPRAPATGSGRNGGRGSHEPTARPSRADAPGAAPVDEDALARAVTAYARALRLSYHAAREPTRGALANEAVAAHLEARALAEEAVRCAAGGHAGRA